MRTVTMRVSALALLLLMTLVMSLGMRTLNRLPDSRIYLVRETEDGFRLESVTRRFGRRLREAQLRAALEALSIGATPEEAGAGLATAFPANLPLRSLRVEGGTVTVDLGRAFAQGGNSLLLRARLEQLLYTLTLPTDITQVRVLLEGRPLTRFGGQVLPDPWQRPPGAPLR